MPAKEYAAALPGLQQLQGFRVPPEVLYHLYRPLLAAARHSQVVIAEDGEIGAAGVFWLQKLVLRPEVLQNCGPVGVRNLVEQLQGFRVPPEVLYICAAPCWQQRVTARSRSLRMAKLELQVCPGFRGMCSAADLDHGSEELKQATSLLDPCSHLAVQRCQQGPVQRCQQGPVHGTSWWQPCRRRSRFSRRSRAMLPEWVIVLPIRHAERVLVCRGACGDQRMGRAGGGRAGDAASRGLEAATQYSNPIFAI